MLLFIWYNQEKEKRMNMIEFAISACLCGENVRYDGGSKREDICMKLLQEGRAITICPEVFGGLPIPRTPSEIVGDKVIMKDGTDVSDAFKLGVQKAIEKIEMYPSIHTIILKEASPSCGTHIIYDGSFTGKKIEGQGMFLRLLDKKYRILSENELSEDLLDLRLVEYGSEMYQTVLELRNKIMRKPMGFDLFDEDLSHEINSVIIGAYDNETLIGFGVMSKQGNSYKLDSLGVDFEIQQKGVGSKLLAYLEEYARSHRSDKLYMDARVSAQSFYEKHGYTASGDTYFHDTSPVPHIKMEKEFV